ncbi:MAG: hypothetical protein C4535_03195 [Comamonadaceae bacterium]|nr:MAG: hypothetical protein C4535_03195 [Comamonadaceae bacterium]
MRHLRAASLVLLLLSGAAGATTPEPAYRFECSSPSGVTQPSINELGCDGDLRVFDGQWEAAAGLGITVTATGTLSLDTLSLSASYIALSAGRGIVLGDGARLVADTQVQMQVGGGSLAVAPGASATLSVAGSDIPLYRDAEALQLLNGGMPLRAPGGSITLVSSVPEPASVALWLSGLLLLLASCVRPRRSRAEGACQYSVM